MVVVAAVTIALVYRLLKFAIRLIEHVRVTGDPICP